MTKLFHVLSNIISANEFGHADTIATLSNTDDITSYAEAAGIQLSDEQAKRISTAGLGWINQVENGDGDWSLYRDEAKEQLED